MSETNRVAFNTAAEAEAAGYGRAGACRASVCLFVSEGDGLMVNRRRAVL
jgi:hypothetical protein